MAHTGVLRPGFVQLRVLDMPAAIEHYTKRIGLHQVTERAVADYSHGLRGFRFLPRFRTPLGLLELAVDLKERVFLIAVPLLVLNQIPTANLPHCLQDVVGNEIVLVVGVCPFLADIGVEILVRQVEDEMALGLETDQAIDDVVGKILKHHLSLI